MALPPVCKTIPICDGIDGLNALRAATKRNPFFAVISGVMHGGQVEYARAQAAGEFLAKLGPAALVNPAEVERLLTPYLPPPPASRSGPPPKRAEQMRLFGLGDVSELEDAPGVQMGVGTMSKRVAAAARAYLRFGPAPGAKFTTAHMNAITYAVCDECRPKAKRREIQKKQGTAEKTGIGKKAGALMREYMGDNQAVAVDRHILDFVFKHTGAGGQIEWRHIPDVTRKKMMQWLEKHPQVYVSAEKGDMLRYAVMAPDGGLQEIPLRGWHRGDTIDADDFAFGEKVIRDLAKKCRVSAAAFQVAAWLQSACGVKGRGVGYSLPLTEGSYFACAPILGQEFLPGLAGLGARMAATRRSVLALRRLPNGRVVTG